MNERTRQGLHALAAALLLGVLGDALLRATPWGLNFFLWTGAGLAASVALLERWRRTALKGDGGWLLLPIILFAAAFAWRDSPTLKWLDGLTVICSFGLLAWRAGGASVKLAGLGAYARGLATALAQTLGGVVPLVFADVQWREIPRNGWSRHALAAARGLLIAVPLLVVFGGLFMAADAIFAGLINRTFSFDPEALISHGLLFSLFVWLTAGYFRGLLFGTAATAPNVPAAMTQPQILNLTTAPVTPPVSITAAPTDPRHAATETRARRVESWRRDDAPAQERRDDADKQTAHEATADNKSDNAASAKPEAAPSSPTVAVPATRFALGAVEVGVVLGLLDALFLGFVCVQVRYLFGGAAWVATTSGLTYAEYARRGFFELAWATALALPLLLALHWLLRPDDKITLRLFRVLALVQLALLFVVIASAITRMRLYQREYGLTELRIYTTAFMGWLALVFIWFAATVLRGARARFACGALVAACFVLAALHFVNPDAAIVRTNVAQARQGRPFDAAYATTLSADAVPALVRALPALTADERCLAARELLARWSSQQDADWRSWSMARSNAWRAVATEEASLHEWACAPPVETVTTTTEPNNALSIAPVTPPAGNGPTTNIVNSTPANRTSNTRPAIVYDTRPLVRRKQDKGRKGRVRR
ncbi:MAG: DUF4153 domain-containing protein [Pyrinomonadaceae bacterium]